MGKTLVVVESPAKSKTIQAYLGSDYIVKASMGHVRDLPLNEFGVDISAGFKPKYVVSDKGKGVVSQLKTQAKCVDQVLLASDPDREGEAIAWHLETLLKKECSNISRIEFNEITKESVNKAVKNPHRINSDLVNSQQARRILDRIVGYELSPWLSQSIQGKLSAGRVQSVALRIVADRDREIKNFKPEEYWKIYANLSANPEDVSFEAELISKGVTKIELKNEAQARAIENDLRGKSYSVQKIERKKKNRAPTAPFTTSTLQQEGGRKLKWDGSKVMKVAQQLYEGVDLGNQGRHGLITYMRTDSTRINEDFQKETLFYVEQKWGRNFVPQKPNIYKTKDAAQDAHEAIRPTGMGREPESVRQYLSDEQFGLYKLIWDRYIASQMAPSVYDTQAVTISSGEYLFKASGYAVVFEGFMKVYMEDRDLAEGQTEKDEKEKRLPVMNEGQTLDLNKLEPKQKFTQPPSKFTEPTLIKELEKLGIGRPSTYATIISTLKARTYVELDKQRRFSVTSLGFQVVDALVRYFPEIMDVKFTSSMEDKLDTVSEGKDDWVVVLREFYGPFQSSLTKAKGEMPAVPTSTETRDEPCPNCAKPMILKNGKNGKFWACTGYPDCKTAAPYIEPNSPTCDKCGKAMTLRNGSRGPFYACTGYPECRNIKNAGGASSGSRQSSSGGKSTSSSSGSAMRGKCSCGGAIVDDNKCYKCTSCNKKVWKNGLEFRGKKNINKTEASNLLSGKTIEVQLIAKNSGKPYLALVSINSEGKLNIGFK